MIKPELLQQALLQKHFIKLLFIIDVLHNSSTLRVLDTTLKAIQVVCDSITKRFFVHQVLLPIY